MPVCVFFTWLGYSFLTGNLLYPPAPATAAISIPTRTFAPYVAATVIPTSPMIAAAATCVPAATPTPASAPASGGAGRIAFVSNRDGNYQIYVMNPDGSGQTRITNNRANDESPAWSPDGKRIAFVSDRDDPNRLTCGQLGKPDCIRQIYVMSADGWGQTRLTNNREDASSPAWSPDGKRIAFASGSGCGFGIYVMNADGSGQTLLTDLLVRASPDSSIMICVDSGNPSWDPSGKQIAFASRGRIYAMNADGSAQTPLTSYTTPANDVHPAWSPGSALVAFASDRDDPNRSACGHPGTPNCAYQIYWMLSDGQGQVRLGNDRADDESPAWSPDSTQIAFVSTRDDPNPSTCGQSGKARCVHKIYIMNIAGSTQTRLTWGLADESEPVWWGPLDLNESNIVKMLHQTNESIIRNMR